MTVALARNIIEEAPNDWLVMVGGEFLGYAKTYDLAQARADEYEARQQPLEDLFGTNQSSILMTVLCPQCLGQTHTIFSYVGGVRRDYRKCNAHATHDRVLVFFDPLSTTIDHLI